MIWFDTTKSARATHHSGLMRVSTRLQAELGAAARPVQAIHWAGEAKADDWYLTAEVFAPQERSGWAELLAERPCRLAAIFHDAIPLQWPQITWPQSVQRHPAYLKMLAQFDRVWAVSESSRRDLLGYWQWLGVATMPPVEVLALGADFDGAPRHPGVRGTQNRALLCVGIIEPRKNQELLLDACEQLWAENMNFELHVVGRVNPHFGGPIRDRLKRLARTQAGLHYHAEIDDRALGKLYEQARAVVFPTRAEGCGLPVIEALWRGLPCVCSDLPVLRESTEGGACLMAKSDDRGVWTAALRQILTDDAGLSRLNGEAVKRTLPTWRETAGQLLAGLRD
jgi:glycosyltransferase involved in cell wall biosynthesis